MAENQAEKGTNPRRGAVLSRMDASAEIWPNRCGADYRAQLASPRNWAVAAAACQMRAGYDIGEGGRAILDNMPVSASGIGAEGVVSVSEGD